MAWDDDSWKDGYEDYDDCDHEDYEIDVCTGRADCNRCNYHWYLTSEEINRELDRQANYYEDMEREERRQWWYDLWHPVWLMRIRSRLAWRPWAKSAPITDDEIPF